MPLWQDREPQGWGSVLASLSGSVRAKRIAVPGGTDVDP
jgi:hypothetical protein